MEKKVSSEIEAAVSFFDAELRNPHFPDEDARIEFYALAHGVAPDLEASLLGCLTQHRPRVAEVIRQKLDEV